MPSHPPILCYVTDRRSLRASPETNSRQLLMQKIAAACAAGIDWIQLREKDLSGRECAAFARGALQTATQSSKSGGRASRIVISDRLDVAIAERAGGVHLGENSLPVEEVKRLITAAPGSRSVQSDFLAGVSCHSEETARSAAAAHGADYLFFGPVFVTPSKAAFGAPQGLERLASVCRAVTIPVLAIGGITVENAGACLAAGAAGIAAIRLFQEAGDLLQIVKKLRAIKASRRGVG